MGAGVYVSMINALLFCLMSSPPRQNTKPSKDWLFIHCEVHVIVCMCIYACVCIIGYLYMVSVRMYVYKVHVQMYVCMYMLCVCGYVNV